MLSDGGQVEISAGQSLEGRIHAVYGQMPAAERKMADLILDFPGDVAAYSATELSELAGVSKAAATRFFQRLGFAGFEEARRQARDAQRWGSPLYLQSKDDRPRDVSGELRRYLDEEIQALTTTLVHHLSGILLAEGPWDYETSDSAILVPSTLPSISSNRGDPLEKVDLIGSSSTDLRQENPTEAFASDSSA